MVYFVDPYKKYYDILSGASNSSSSISSTSDKISSADKIISNINSSITGSQWTELGVEELAGNVIPNLKSNMSVFAANFEILSQMSSKAFGELYPATKNLKEADEKYEEVLNELNSLVSVSPTNSDGSANPDYQTYVSKKDELEKKKEEYKLKCEEYVRDCNTAYNSIKSLDSSATAFKVEVKLAASSKKNDTKTIIESVEGGKLLKVSVEGREFYICNSKINALDYEKYVQKYGLTQNNGLLGGQCLVLSQYYAVDMMRGTWTSKSTMASGGGSPATRINDVVTSESIDPILKYIYEETLAGRPTVLQVTQVNSYKGERHLVTVVGFDSSVKSYKDLNADNILVLDCVDGKVQTLSKSRASGGHERDIYAQAGKYSVRGATDAFKSQEVQTVNA